MSPVAGFDQVRVAVGAVLVLDEDPRHVHPGNVLVEQHDVAALADQRGERAVVGRCWSS